MGTATERLLALAGDPRTLIERDALFRRSPRQRALYEALEASGGRAQVRHIVDQLGFGDAVVRALVKRGIATIAESERVRDPFASLPASAPPERLTSAQSSALAAIESLDAGAGALLFGVTGSGKTLVYLEAVRRELARGRGAIVLVPEIGLTPQTVSRLRGAFGDQVAVLHSGLSDGERADAWRLLRRGERRVAVGARSAVFAPVRRPRHHRRGRGARGELQERRSRRATTRATLPPCERASRAHAWCSGAPRLRSSRWSGATSHCACSGSRSGWACVRCRRSSWWISG